jgi:hypothetical protein
MIMLAHRTDGGALATLEATQDTRTLNRLPQCRLISHSSSVQVFHVDDRRHGRDKTGTIPWFQRG